MRIVYRLLAALLRLIVWPLLWLRERRAIGKGAWLHLTIDGAVTDLAPAPRFWEWRRKRALSLFALRRGLEEAGADARVKGVLVTLRSFRGGMATAASLHAALSRVRALGKELVVHLPLGGDTREVYLATAADRVLLGPQATLAPVGFATTGRYLKGALEKLGVVPEVLARGDFKSAGETLVREQMSDAQRVQLTRILDSFYAALVEALAKRPGLTAEGATAVIDGAPYTGVHAVAARLADAVAYDDEVAGLLGKDVEPVELADYLRLRHALRFEPIRPRAALGVIRVHGPIVGGGGGPFSRASEPQIVSAIRAARRSRRVRGVLLDVSSPGGSALASDRIHHELVQLAREKPLVAYLGDVAASGGYYVAAAAHAIVAQETTITGSIGVVAARFTAEPLLSRLGVNSSLVQRGARAAMNDPLRPLSPDERTAVERELDSVYDAFLSVVAQGRKRPLAEVRTLAEGRVWTGKDAHAHGLVDTLGGFDVALEALRAKVGPRGKGLEPALVRGGGEPGAPLPPPDGAEAARKPAQALLAALGAVAGDPWMFEERVLLYCAEAAALNQS